MQQRPTLHAFVTRQNFRNSTMKMCGKCAEMKSDIKWKTFVQPELFLLAGTFGFRRSWYCHCPVFCRNFSFAGLTGRLTSDCKETANKKRFSI